MGAFLILMFIIIIVIGFVKMILEIIGDSKDRSSAKSNLSDLLKQYSIKNYEVSDLTAGNEYIVHDRANERFWIVFNSGGTGRYYEQISKVELKIDDSVAYQSSLGSAVGRAVVGGVLAGGVGAIIGGVTGKKNGSKVVHKVEMIISFNTPNKPFEKVTFLSDQKGVDTFSDEYKRAEKNGLYWSNLISSYMPK